MPTRAALTREIAERLQGATIPSASLRKLAGVAAAVNLDLKLEDLQVFPIGIVINDGVGLKGNVPIDAIGNVLDIIRSHPEIGSIEIFPIGIVAPDRARVKIGLR